MKQIASLGGGLVLCIALMLVIPAVGAKTPAPDPPPEINAPVPDAPAPMTDIHDILPPVAVGIHAPWLLPVLLALAAMAILAAAWWFWKKHKKARIIETIVPELPPEMTATRALDEIADVGRLDGKTFYFRLSAILRQYVSGRFALGAPEMTTEEFVPCIDRLHIDKSLAHQLRRLCRAMDPVKFGAEAAMEKQMETDLFFTREFVRRTTPTADTENSTNGGNLPKALPQAGS